MKRDTSETFKSEYSKIVEVYEGSRARDFLPQSFDASKSSGYTVERCYAFIALPDFVKMFQCQPVDLGELLGHNVMTSVG